MSATTETLNPVTRSALNVELVTGRARDAAREGDLDEAVRLLGALDADNMANTTVLDLLAKVHAQRGEYGAADEYWSRVQAITPSDPHAAAGRRAVAEITAGRRRARPRARPGWAAAVAVTLVGAALGGTIWLAPGAGPNAGPEPGAGTALGEGNGTTRLQEAVRRVDTLERRLAEFKADRAQAVARRRSTLKTIAQDLAMEGLRVQRRKASVRVNFQTGLYVRRNEITDEGAALLARVGERLAGAGVSIKVVGHAVAVPGGRTSGGSVVALARALFAAKLLAQSSDMPLTEFTLVSADQTDGPFTEAARNRTVTLVITPTTPQP